MVAPAYVEQLYTALHDRTAVDFLLRALKASYLEYYYEYQAEINAMIEQAIVLLESSQATRPNEAQLHTTIEYIKKRIFRKGDESFWFNRIYRDYKRSARPRHDLSLIKEHIRGGTILDFGCGGGYFSSYLVELGHTVYMTDVLDYRTAEAVALPFVAMPGPDQIPFPSRAFDTTISKNVLHHVNEEYLLSLINELHRVSKRVLIQEDTYCVAPEDADNFIVAYESQPFLREYLSCAQFEQYHYLVLLDYFANAIALGALGAPDINFAFGFKPPKVWRSLFEQCGFVLQRSFMFGFEAGKMHKDCQVWMVFDCADHG